MEEGVDATAETSLEYEYKVSEKQMNNLQKLFKHYGQ